MASLEFVTLDVFTDRAFGGNPLAIFPDARGIDAPTMQAIATELNLSETMFLLPPPTGSEAVATVRIFTPVNELPFAGHPNVGAAFHVANDGLFGQEVGDHFIFDERAGPVECFIDRTREKPLARIAAPRPLFLGQPIDVAVVSACAALPDHAIATGNHSPLMISVGLPFFLAEVTDLDTLAAAAPIASAFVTANAKYRPADDFFSLYLYVRDTADPWQVRARMFSPLSNIPEDPATGSAAAALGAFLASRPQSRKPQTFAITQGVEMGRRSDMLVTVGKTGITVGGHCVEMQRGTMTF